MCIYLRRSPFRCQLRRSLQIKTFAVTLALILSSPSDDAALCALLAEAPLEDLVWLELSNNRLGEACLEALASSQRLPVLACLGFQGNKAPDPTWRVYDDPLGGVASVQPQGAGEALQSRFGPKAWLSRPRFELQHPPPALFYPYGNDLQPQAVQS